MPTYKYGQAGIGSNVQIGRRGGHLDWFDASSVYRLYEADNATLANVRVATDPINANDAASKSYVDSLVAGLSPKDAVRVASTAPLVLATDFENGDTIDGVVLVTGDRILIKDQATPTENGIYTVNVTGAPTRSTDADSSTDLAAAFVFIQEGTALANEGWVTSFIDSQTIGVDPISWSKFSSAGLNTASNGIKLVGADIQMDITALSGATAIVAADEMAFYDVSGGVPLKRTWTNIIGDLNITTSGVLTGGTGINITTGTITFDNSGMADTAVVGTDTVPFFDTSAANQAEFRSWANILADLNVVNNIAVNGFVVQSATNTYVGRSVVASVTASEEGIIVTNGDGVAGNPTVGLDINGLTADAATVATDEFVYFNGTNNVKIDRDGLATELLGVSQGVRVMEVSFGAANAAFAVTLPVNARVQRTRVVIDTIDATADVSVTSGVNTIFATISADASIAGTFEDDTDYRNTSGTAETVTVVVAAATVVAGRCYVEYYQNSLV